MSAQLSLGMPFQFAGFCVGIPKISGSDWDLPTGRELPLLASLRRGAGSSQWPLTASLRVLCNEGSRSLVGRIESVAPDVLHRPVPSILQP